MDRRFFLESGLATALSAFLPGGPGRRSRLLLRSSWQTVNIGDVGHTPGVLALLERLLPGVEVRLWPSDVGAGVDRMLARRFPAVAILRGAAEVDEAIRSSDFLLHGSGPSLVAAKDVRRWREATGKPYGVFGITLPSVTDELRGILGGAAFVYFRDTVSLQLARAEGVACPVMDFGPDGAFAVDLRDDASADAFLGANGLEPGRFLCCIPRLRWTPYWTIKGRPFDAVRHARNEEMKERDHAPLRAAIGAVVKEAGLKVLLCPEDASQMAVGKELLHDRLPEDVRKGVVWREKFWRTDEALSTYARSAGLFGLEMHSPILAVGNGIPALVGRFAEQTSKGQMWRDVGLGDWLFDVDRPEDLSALIPTVLWLARNPKAARERAERARELVRNLHAGMVQRLAAELGA